MGLMNLDEDIKDCLYETTHENNYDLVRIIGLVVQEMRAIKELLKKIIINS